MHSDLTIISFGIQLETKDNILIHQMLSWQEAWLMLAVLRQTPQLAQSNKYRAEVELLTFKFPNFQAYVQPEKCITE